MKKKLVSFVCLIAVLAMLFTLTGCSEKQKLVGNWKADVNFAQNFEKSLGDSEEAQEMLKFINFNDFATLSFLLTFSKDGTYSMQFDESSVDTFVSRFRETLGSALTSYLEDKLAAEGLDMSAEEVFAMMGTTKEALLDEYFNEDSVEQLIDDCGELKEGNYDAKDGKLYLSDSLDAAIDENVYDIYQLDGDRLTLLESFGSDDPDGFAESLYPITFVKQ